MKKKILSAQSEEETRQAIAEAEKEQLAALEIRQLKETIAALRDQLEVEGASKDTEVQKTLAQSNGEIVQLRQTIVALREEMSKVHIGYEQKMADQEREARDENRQLQMTIQTLRDQLEGKRDG